MNPQDLTASTQTSPGSDARSTAFRPVEGGGETRSGTVLLVEAYAAIWLILFAMLWLGFRKQRRLDTRLQELERTIERGRGAL